MSFCRALEIIPGGAGDLNLSPAFARLPAPQLMTRAPSANEYGVAVRGDSVAAWCWAWLLTKARFKPALERTARPRLPAIMLSERAL